MAIPPQFIKKNKPNPNNDGDGMLESQESPAQKKTEARNGGKPSAAMVKNAALARMIGK